MLAAQNLARVVGQLAQQPELGAGAVDLDAAPATPLSGQRAVPPVGCDAAEIVRHG